MIDDVLKKFNEESEKTKKSFSDKLNTFRTGRASISLIENLMIDSYGSKMPLKSLSSITVPEAKMLLVQVWDRNLIPEIEKAILTSNLGLSPQTEDTFIRVIVPPLTGERREEYKKLAKQEAENHRIIIRQHRKEGIDMIKTKKENKELSEDEERRSKESFQKAVELQIAEIDSLLDKKLEDLDKV